MKTSDLIKLSVNRMAKFTPLICAGVFVVVGLGLSGCVDTSGYAYGSPGYDYAYPGYRYTSPGYGYGYPSYGYTSPGYGYGYRSYGYASPGYGYGYPSYGYGYSGQVTVAIDDRPYYVHGPGYWVGRSYYAWTPGYWRHYHGHRYWTHGHYVVRT